MYSDAGRFEELKQNTHTLATLSAVSRKSTHLVALDLARNSSMSLMPMLYPLQCVSVAACYCLYEADCRIKGLHSIKLFVDFFHILKVCDQLPYNRAIRECEDLRVLQSPSMS